MIKKIALLSHYNRYESKRLFCKKLSKALNHLGISTQIFDIENSIADASLILDLIQFEPDLTCSFNHLLPLSDGRCLWDVWGIPHLSFVVDPVIYFMDLKKGDLSIISCVDRFDVDFIRSGDFKKAFFLPHASSLTDEIINQEKIYDVVLLGTCYDYEGLPEQWQKIFPKKCHEIIEYASERVLTDDTVSVTQALVDALNEYSIDLKEVNIVTLHHYIDFYTRGIDRVNLVRSIKDAKVHIFGSGAEELHPATRGWEAYVGDQENVIIHPEVSFTESLQVLQQAKICLNSMPFFRDGTHERVFNAFSAEALPITSYSRYLQEEFSEGESIVFYHPKMDINEKINQLLNNEQQRLDLVYAGKEIVNQHHSWDNRAVEMIENLTPIVEPPIGT